MSVKIAEGERPEWARFAEFGDHFDPAWPEHPDRAVRQIRLANAALPDSDPRKITHAGMIAALRQAAGGYRNPELPKYARDGFANGLDGIADALESYLPPEKP